MLQATVFGSTAGHRNAVPSLTPCWSLKCHAFPNSSTAKASRSILSNGPNAVRLIAIAEAWLRLGAIVCLRKEPDIGTDQADAGQLGVGIPGGAHNIGHAINAAHTTDPSNTLAISFEWANAFNAPS